MKQWCEEEPDYGFESDYFVEVVNPRDNAFNFFQYRNQKALATLGVIIVEGDSPGNYYAAELEIPIEEANRKAIAAKIPIRFKADGLR